MQNRESAGIGLAFGIGALSMSIPSLPYFFSELPAWSKYMVFWIGLILVLASIAAYFFPSWFSVPLGECLVGWKKKYRKAAKNEVIVPTPLIPTPPATTPPLPKQSSGRVTFVHVVGPGSVEKMTLTKNTMDGVNFMVNEGKIGTLEASENIVTDKRDEDQKAK
jgi:hypothetical protein